MPTSLLDSIPPTHHAEDSVDSNTSGARSTPSDSIAPLSPDHPLTYALPTLVPIIHRTARMAVRVPPAMSLGLSASIADVAAMSDSAFCKRFRSFYECSPSSSPPDLPLWKHYRGTSELVEDDEEEDDEEDDEEEEDEEVEESSDSDIESEDAEDESPNAEDKDPAAGDGGFAVGDEGPGVRVESLGLGGDVVVREGQQRAALVMETDVGERLGLSYEALRRHEIALGEGWMPSVFEVGKPRGPPVQTPPSPEWSSSLLPVSLAPSIEGLIHDHTVRLGELSPDLFERYDRDLGELFTRSGVVRDEIFSQRYRFRSLMYEHERFALTFRELRLQIAEERRTRLDLAEIVDSMKKGQEPRGDA
ncbi:hypothetical protein Tco_1513081 [Tanacetum coccineum]